MRARALVLLLLAGCVQRDPGPVAARSTKSPPDPASPTLTLDAIFGTPSLAGVSPSGPAWSPDGRHLAFLWSEDGTPARHLYVVGRDGAGRRRLSAAQKVSTTDFGWRDAETLLGLRGPELWSFTLDGAATRIATVGAGASDLSIAPSGDKAAFLKDGDLHLVDLRSGAVRAATDVGIPALSDLGLGRYDRREREIGPGIWGGPTYAWSPDGATIAVHHVDRRVLPKVPFPDYLADETAPNPIRRGYPGGPNERRTLGLLDVETGKLRLLALEDPAANQIIDFSWSPTNVLLLDRASDTNVDRWIDAVDRETGESTRIWHGRRPTRIYTAFASAWHPDGRRVIFLSDREDRYGLYLVDPGSDAPPQRLTDPAYDVLSGPAVTEGAVFFSANGTGPHEKQVYRLELTTGETSLVARLNGQNRGLPSPDGLHVAILHDDEVSPPELYLASVAQGEASRVTTSPPDAFREHEWVRGRYVDFPSRTDDARLRARILEPPELDPDRRYPVVFGPVYSNTARDRWSGRYSLVQQLIVQKGYIVMQVDVRGSTGYGRAFREAFLADFAGQDLEDLASGVEYVKNLPYVDPDRIGVWGSSYGGTLTVYALLTKPGLFRAGVAAAAAVDPHFFGTDDVAIVRRPDTQPEIFERAARRYAENLQDHLLLIHGMQDQIVPFKTTVVLADALIRAGKDFDYAFGPRATHMWSREGPYARFLFGKLVDHFDRHLKAAESP